MIIITRHSLVRRQVVVSRSCVFGIFFVSLLLAYPAFCLLFNFSVEYGFLRVLLTLLLDLRVLKSF